MVTMMTFIAASNEEDLLTHEVSDEALEAAGGNEAKFYHGSLYVSSGGLAKQPARWLFPVL
jgi:hypothetical protein